MTCARITQNPCLTVVLLLTLVGCSKPGEPELPSATPPEPATVIDPVTLTEPATKPTTSDRSGSSSPRTIRSRIRFVAVPPGMHNAGDSVVGPWHDPRTERRRLVSIGSIAISTTEVSESQYWAIVDPDRVVPSARGHYPMTNISFEEARRFTTLLSIRLGRTFRLPTEFEWDVACAAKPGELFGVWRGECPQKEAIQAYQDGDKGKLTRGSKASFCFDTSGPGKIGMGPANALGIHEMHGGVWEWCLRDPRYDVRDRPGMQPIKGGAFSSTSLFDCRHGHRSWEPETSRKNSIGFRVVCESSETEMVIEF